MLAELLVAVGIMTIVGSAMVGVLYQMNNVASRGPAHLAVEADMRNAMQWLAKDLRRAWTTDLADGVPVSCATVAPSPCVTIDWSEVYGGTTTDYAAWYALDGTELTRSLDAGDDGVDVVTHTVVREVTEAEFSLSGRLVLVSVTSTSDAWAGITNQFSHYFYIRPF